MIKELTGKIYKVLMWSYDRGTWQYDLIVCLILAFVFLTPRTFFNTEKIDKRILAYSQTPAPSSPNPGEKRFISFEPSGDAPAPSSQTGPHSERDSRSPSPQAMPKNKN